MGTKKFLISLSYNKNINKINLLKTKSYTHDWELTKHIKAIHSMLDTSSLKIKKEKGENLFHQLGETLGYQQIKKTSYCIRGHWKVTVKRAEMCDGCKTIRLY